YGPPRRHDRAAIHQDRISAYADQTAPGLRADEWTDFQFAEVPRQRVAARTGKFIDEHHLRPVNAEWLGNVVALSGCHPVQNGAAEIVHDVIRQPTAVIEAFINDGGLFVGL